MDWAGVAVGEQRLGCWAPEASGPWSRQVRAACAAAWTALGQERMGFSV